MTARSISPEVPSPRPFSKPIDYKKRIHTFALAENPPMCLASPPSRAGPIFTCLAAVRDLKLGSQEVHGTLRDVVARTGAVGRDTAMHDWRLYIERYENIVADAAKAASQLRALIKVYLVLQEKRHEGKGEEMAAELSNLLNILSTYHFDFRGLLQQLQDDISVSYGCITIAVLESTQSSGASDKSVTCSTSAPNLPGAALVDDDPSSETPQGDNSDRQLRATMVRILKVMVVTRLKRPGNKSGTNATASRWARLRNRGVPTRAMSDPVTAAEKASAMRRLLSPHCGSIDDFEEPAYTDDEKPPRQLAPTEPAGDKGYSGSARRWTTGAVEVVSTGIVSQMVQAFEAETLGKLSTSITCVLTELDRLAPKFDAFSELAQHLRNEISTYIHAFTAYQNHQTPAKRNALEHMHSRAETTSVLWKECLDVLGEGVSRSSR